ncbi:MAG TPA: ATP-binding protein [Candidatus Sumerlaeota bacterium]|nr:MAG: Sensor protein ZraS [candidate division BRC1 bacterium ADurb.BinA292]HPK02483.1 ATP-binding protein [Candidatus Sumerlaeota bacterium]
MKEQQPTRTFTPGELSGGWQLTLRPRELVPGLKPEYIIDQFPAAIGRHPTNDIELPFDAVSRYHARIEIYGGKPRIIDLRSSNGTYVNGKRVQVAPIVDQDGISFGSLEFSLTIQEFDSDQRVITRSDQTSAVHFVQQDDMVQTVIHADLPDDTSVPHLILEEDITDEETLRKAKIRLICLYRLQEVLRSTADEEKLMRNVLRLLFEVLPVDRGVMLMRDKDDPAVFRPCAVKVRDGLASESIGISRTILQRGLRERIAILTRNAPEDSRFQGAESIVANSMRSVMCVPLISARHVFGFCHLDTVEPVRMFTQEDLTFLATVCAEMATHLHNLRMVQDKIQTERMAAIGQTITGMAHNIKNILLLSQGGVEMMDKQLERKQYDTVEETWGVVRRGLERIHGLVADMLDYSRARTIEKRPIDLGEFLTELCATFADEMRKRNIDCRLELAPDLPRILVDVDGLEKAVVNLIVNALEALPEDKGTVTLRTLRNDEGHAQIEVEDDAGGIPAEVLPRIFVPFFTTKGSKGSGLGLAMTRKFIEDMGGRIEAHSSEGVGTRFTITLYTEPEGPRLKE